jgi:putative methionine-R-sulfoxide reductase with GAF domain
MRRKYENIALILFLISLVIIILTIVLIQQNLSEIAHSDNLEKIQKYTASNSKNLIISLIILALIAAINLSLLFRHSSEMRKRIQKSDNLKSIEEQDDLKAEDNKQEITKNLRNIELQKFNVLSSKIEALDTKDISKKVFCDNILSIIATEYEVFQGLFYIINEEKTLSIAGSYAYNKSTEGTLQLGEGLAGQVAKAKRTVNIKQIPTGYIKAISGLGETTPTNLLICPLLHSKETCAVIELATFKEFSKEEETYFTTLGEIINNKLSSLI